MDCNDTNENDTNENFAVYVSAMRQALEEARFAEGAGDVPVGAVVIADGAVVAAAHNERESLLDPTAHAELLALRAAALALGRGTLEGCTLVVTLEPCVMCAGGILASRVDHVVFGAFDPKAGACGSRYNLLGDPRLGREVPITSGILDAEAAEQLTAFFSSRRLGRGGAATA